MVKYSILFLLACIGATEMANADHLLFHPRNVIVAPVVAYQPAYIVPVATHVVAMPVQVTTVVYATSYYAPMVPVVTAAPVVYAPPVHVAPVYATPMPSGPVYGYNLRSRLNVHRNGSFSYHVNVR